MLLLQYNIPNPCSGVDSVAVRDNACLFLDKMSDGPLNSAIIKLVMVTAVIVVYNFRQNEVNRNILP